MSPSEFSQDVTSKVMTSIENSEIDTVPQCGKLVPVDYVVDGEKVRHMEPCQREQGHPHKHDALYYEPLNTPESDIIAVEDERHIDLPRNHIHSRRAFTCNICGEMHYTSRKVDLEDEPIIEEPEEACSWTKEADERCNAEFLDGKHPQARNPYNPKEWPR